MGKVLCLGGPVDGQTRDVSPSCRTFRVIDNGIYEYRSTTFNTESGQVEAFVWGDLAKIRNAQARLEEFARIPAFLLGDQAPPPVVGHGQQAGREPTDAEFSAALLAYDKALPYGVDRPPLAEHGLALRAALIAAFQKGE